MTTESATLWGCAALILGTPPRLSRFPLGCLSHTQFGLPLDLNADECRLCFLGAALVSEKMSRCEPLAHVRHTQKCTHARSARLPRTHALIQIYSAFLLDPWPPRNASQGRLRFCSSSRKPSLAVPVSVIPPRLLPLQRKKLRSRVWGQVSPQLVLITK